MDDLKTKQFVFSDFAGASFRNPKDCPVARLLKRTAPIFNCSVNILSCCIGYDTYNMCKFTINGKLVPSVCSFNFNKYAGFNYDQFQKGKRLYWKWYFLRWFMKEPVITLDFIPQ